MKCEACNKEIYEGSGDDHVCHDERCLNFGHFDDAHWTQVPCDCDYHYHAKCCPECKLTEVTK